MSYYLKNIEKFLVDKNDKEKERIMNEAKAVAEKGGLVPTERIMNIMGEKRALLFIKEVEKNPEHIEIAFAAMINPKL